MTVRPPRNFTPSTITESGLGVLEYELMSERATALGRNGVAAEEALARLKDGESRNLGAIEQEKLVDAAAQLVWSLFIQRRSAGCGTDATSLPAMAFPAKCLHGWALVLAINSSQGLTAG